MSFLNTCPITFDNIDKENSLLVKVPASKIEEKDKLYYIKDENTLSQLHKCPLTNRIGAYYTIKLASLSEKELASLQVDNSPNELIEENNPLIQLTAKFKWKNQQFTPEANPHQYNITSPHDLALFTQGGNHSFTNVLPSSSLISRNTSSNHRLSMFSFFAPPRPRPIPQENELADVQGTQLSLRM
ncbi:hypothetical protein [Legionella tucsonensis]|uniref:Uncharacterized protein n=1 Tax=Legionella tucsonensis TaxID=40335 RepID=A0A0W0ZWB3_9GAMM|nr:hypothetical protein [Legionella tucsonensis]KTD73368.1 hypothetical protein Ltuc_1215 [Legionella tucsonensis]